MSQNASSRPFYVPIGQQRSIQIINETKAEIKKMQSYRPSTPFRRKNVNIAFKGNSLSSTRSSSCASVRSLKYDAIEKSETSSIDLNSSITEKGTIQKYKNIKLEPLVTKPFFIKQKVSRSPLSIHSDPEFLGLPPIANSEESMNHELEFDSTRKPEDDALLSEKEFPALEPNFNLIHKPFELTSSTLEALTKSFIEEEHHEEDEDEIMLPDAEIAEVIEDSKHLLKYVQVLEKHIHLGFRKHEEVVIEAVIEISNWLEAKNAFTQEFAHRVSLLKCLFRLLDTKFPVLGLHALKILLQMEIKGKNLANLFRFILRLMKQEVDFDTYEITHNLLPAIKSASILTSKEAVFYGVTILKKMLLGNVSDKPLLIAEILPILFFHFRESNIAMEYTGEYNIFCGQVITQIISVLHCVADQKPVWVGLLETSNLVEFFKALQFSLKDSEVVTCLVGIISKIVDTPEGCHAAINCGENFPVIFLPLLNTYKYNFNIILQVTYTIQCLLSAEESMVLQFLNCPRSKKALMGTLEDYTDLHMQSNRNVLPDILKNSYVDNEDRDWRQDITEGIVKILCILSHMCLCSEAGCSLAKEYDVVMRLLKIATRYVAKGNLYEGNMVLIFFLSVIASITFYLPSDSEFNMKIAESVIPLLDKNHPQDVRYEAAKITGNLMRCPEIRTFVQDSSMLPAFVRLLSEEGKGFSRIAYGIIMNILLNPNAKRTFYEENGISKMLQQLHLSVDRDWETSALLCQIIWNYCSGEVDEVFLTKMEIHHLVKFLSYATNKNRVESLGDEDSEDYWKWKNQFCSVAKELLNLLQKKRPIIF